jgi:hypothetical protein
MSARVQGAGSRLDVVSGMPDPVDLADLWLMHALSSLLDACDVPRADRQRLVESRESGTALRIWPVSGKETGRLQRFDASRLAVLFSALAVEARLDRLLRHCDAADWPAVKHLAPEEKLRLAPRLLGREDRVDDSPLWGVALALFHLRGELVDADGKPGAALAELSPDFSVSRAREMVAGGAKICSYLAGLADEHGRGASSIVEETADALQRRAVALSTRELPASPDWRSGRDNDADFPPNIVGT